MNLPLPLHHTQQHPRKHLLAAWPAWSSRWFGYRVSPPPKLPDYTIWFWSFVGSFCAIALLQAVFSRAAYFVARDVPSIVASYGATAVLIYGAVESPFAQPRAVLGGHFLAGLIGICITKLFHLLPTEERFQDLLWLAGSLSCATAVAAMQITNTTHPPAGATALLAAISPDIRRIGWYYLPVILLSSTLALVVALIIDNIQRRYPVYWFFPSPAPATATVLPPVPSWSGESGTTDAPPLPPKSVVETADVEVQEKTPNAALTRRLAGVS